jgi:putative flippase GtrA
MTPRERWIRFATVGTLGVAIQLAAVGLLADRWHVGYLRATAIGVLAAIAHNFAWHRCWTWRDRPDSRGLVVTFFAFSAANGLVSLAGNLLVMRVLVGTLHTPAIAANLAAIATCAVVNYLVADRAVFSTAGTTGASGAALPTIRPDASM